MLSVRRMENGIYSMSDNKSPHETLEKIYDFIRTYIQENNGYPPSMRQIAKGCYMSVSNAIRYLDKLEGQGRIHREPGLPRSIRLIEQTSDKNGTDVRTDVHPD